jgi:hypothetical protein
VSLNQNVKFLATARRKRGGGVLAVVVMLLLWLGTFALTASPDLHRLLHADSKNPSHHCLITQLQQQPLLAGFAAPVAPVSLAQGLAAALPSDAQFLRLQVRRLSPSRGPPVSVSSIQVGG